MSYPTIESLEWGSVKIEYKNKIYNYKDVVITHIGLFKWDFKEGFDNNIDEVYTSHQFKTNMKKGIQPYSVRDLLKEADVFILTTGFHGDLGVNENTIKLLENNGKKVHVVNTAESMNLYNDLAKKHKVIALIHSTC